MESVFLCIIWMRASSVTQSCPTLCDPMDYSPLGSSVHGIFQARVLSGLKFPPPRDFPDQDDIAILNVYVPSNRATKYMKQN